MLTVRSFSLRKDGLLAWNDRLYFLGLSGQRQIPKDIDDMLKTASMPCWGYYFHPTPNAFIPFVDPALFPRARKSDKRKFAVLNLTSRESVPPLTSQIRIRGTPVCRTAQNLASA